MNSTIHKINLDIHRMGAQVSIPMWCGDTERSIVITLMEKGKLYRISEGCTAKFSAKKPDGNFIYNDCIVDYEKNTITYDIGSSDENGTRVSQTTAVIGEVDCQLSLIGKDGGVISTPHFTIVVSPNVYGNEPINESAGEYNALTAYVADLERKVANGEFNGEKGDQGEKGEKGEQGIQGEKGDKGDPGNDYILTEADKKDIADLSNWELISNETIPEAEAIETVSEYSHKEWLEEEGINYYYETLNPETNIYSLESGELEYYGEGNKYNVYKQDGTYVGYFTMGAGYVADEIGTYNNDVITDVPYLKGYNAGGWGFILSECGYGEPYVIKHVTVTKDVPKSYIKDLGGKYKKLLIYFSFPYGSGYTAKGYMNFLANGTDNFADRFYTNDALIPMPTASNGLTLVKFLSEIVGKKTFSSLQFLSSNSTHSGRYGQTSGDLNSTFFPLGDNYFETLQINTVNMAFTVGTKIEIYGVRA